MKLLMAHTINEVRQQVAAWRSVGLTVALVPTMGALHEGHLALIEKALSVADRVVVSIFVNPSQFGPSEDFARYPRPLEADKAMAYGAGAHLLYLPSVEVMYPADFSTWITVDGLSDGLCGRLRRGHFRGVATIVTKLLVQVGPDVAVFGEKDYQQLSLIRRLARDLDLPTRIEGAAIVREADGLALSSRNTYLSPEQRRHAPALYALLQNCARALESGVPVTNVLATGLTALAGAGFDPVDYLELCDTETLVPLTTLDRPARLLAAGYLGTTRLIDNIAVGTAPL